MKKLKFSLLLASILCLCLSLSCGIVSADTKAEPQADDTRYNIMTNGSFEETIAGGEYQYELQWGAQQYTAADGNDENVRTGSRSILLDCSTGSAPPFAKNTNFFDSFTLPLVTFGEEYEFTMWVRATDGFRGYGFLNLYYNTDQDYGSIATADGKRVSFANNESNVEDVWTEVTYRFTLNGSYDKGGVQTPVTGFRFVFMDFNVVKPGKLYIDDISLKKVPVELEEGQINSFEGLNVTANEEEMPFLYADAAGSSPAIDTSVSVPDTGSASIKVMPTGGDGSLYRYLDRSQFANDIYIFSFYVKGEGVWRATGEYPNGLVALPTVAANNTSIDTIPESLVYGTASFRRYTQGYLPGYMREDGELCGNGGLTLPTSEAEKTDFGWTKVEIPFNPYGLPDGAKSEDGKVTFSADDVTNICLLVKLNGVSGTLWFDDFKVYRSGTAEPEYREKVRFSFGEAVSPAPIPFAAPYTFPEATAIGLGDTGEYDVDLSSQIKVTLEHSRDLGGGVEGWYVYPDHSQLPMNEESLTFTPDWHGHYRLRYEVTHNGETIANYFYANIQDTLMSIAVNSSAVEKEILYGEEIDVSGITVTKTMSYSGDAPVEVGKWTVDLGGYTTASEPGTYTVTVSYTEQYGGTKTDSFTVEVKDYATDFSMLTPPSKLSYTYGEAFDKTGLTAEVTLAYGGKQTLTAAQLEIDGYDATKVGKQSVAACYGDKKGETFEVTVSDAMDAVVADTDSVKKSYSVGEEIDLTGLVVQKVMKSGERITVEPSGYTVDYGGYTASSPAGSYTVRVSVTENGVTETASFSITVTAASSGDTAGGCSGSIGFGSAFAFAALGLAGAAVIGITFKRRWDK